MQNLTMLLDTYTKDLADSVAAMARTAVLLRKWC
jgi:hypothetical protein